MEEKILRNSPDVNMNNTTYNMVSLNPSVRIDEMKFRTIGGGPSGPGYGYGGLGLGGLGPYSGALPGTGLSSGAFELSSPYASLADPAALGFPSAIQPNLNLASDAIGYEEEYEFTGDEGSDRDVDNDDYDYNEVRMILMKIQRYNPGIFKAFLRMGMPYYEVRRLMRKIIRLTMMYSEENE